MALVVRRATKQDARTIAEFALKLFAQHHDYDPERFAQLGNLEGAEWFYGSQTEADNVAVLVAEIDNKVVGFAFMQYEEVNYADLLEKALWVHDIYVDESARRNGAGKALMESAAEIAAQFGADKIALSVAAKNEYARAFFKQSGLRETMVEMTLNLSK